MKPHCMFFDEQYNERFYRYDTVKEFCAEADCLIVVGTALATGFASSIVRGFLIRELPVIEVNLESSINRGFNIQVLQKSEIALPALFSEFYRLRSKPAPSNLGKQRVMAAKKAPSPKGTQNPSTSKQTPTS